MTLCTQIVDTLEKAYPKTIPESYFYTLFPDIPEAFIHHLFQTLEPTGLIERKSEKEWIFRPQPVDADDVKTLPPPLIPRTQRAASLPAPIARKASVPLPLPLRRKPSLVKAPSLSTIRE